MTNPTNTNEIDDLLKRFHQKLLIGWVINDGKVHDMPAHGTHDGCIDDVKQALYQAVLAVIGEENPLLADDYIGVLGDDRSEVQVAMLRRNKLRAEQRKALAKLFNQKEV